jgi:hypothetical protein
MRVEPGVKIYSITPKCAHRRERGRESITRSNVVHISRWDPFLSPYLPIDQTLLPFQSHSHSTLPSILVPLDPVHSLRYFQLYIPLSVRLRYVARFPKLRWRITSRNISSPPLSNCTILNANTTTCVGGDRKKWLAILISRMAVAELETCVSPLYTTKKS